MAYDESLERRIADALGEEGTPFVAKKMFGGIAFMVRGQMAVGIVNANVVPDLAPAVRLARLVWMGIGNAELLYAAVYVAQHAEDVASANVIFGTVVVALLAARTLDVLRLGGTTTRGEPATVWHLRRYAFGLVAISGLLWAAGYASRSWFVGLGE